ncbi:MAG: Ig-like domain-containing protein [Leptospiraceae bacterium]|nr:Ig-like domain-containing protein [Leptospiraceae bacterium]
MKKSTIVLLNLLIILSLGCGGGKKKGFLPFLGLGDEADGSSKGDTTLESIYVTPPKDAIAVETFSKFKATGIYADGTHKDITDSVTWSSETTSISEVDTAGKAKGITPGQTKIIATQDGMSGNGDLTVKDVTLEYIEITRFEPIAAGTSATFKAIGVFSDGTTQDLTDFVDWSSSDGGVAPINNVDDGTKGKASGSSTGQTTVTATLAGVSGTSTLDVVSKTLVSISIDPDTSIAKNSLKSYKATGTFSDGSTQDLTNDVTWSSSDTGIATIENSAALKGKATGMSSGSATISATFSGITGSSVLSVTSATLTSISIGPDVSIAKGTNKQFVAMGTFSDGSTLDISDMVTWTSSLTDIAGVSNVSGSEGYAQSLTTGTSKITAALGSVTGSANLTITSATLSSISVSPGSATIVAGTTQQFTATGIYSDGTSQDITDVVSWSSANEVIAMASNISGNNGLTYGDSAGTVGITATLDGVSGSANLTVNPAVTLSSISVTPATKSIAKGLTQQYTATAIYSDGTNQDVTNSATWSSGTTSTATISNASGTQGLATSANTGSTVISATWNGKTGNANLTVTAATVVSIAVTPANQSV